MVYLDDYYLFSIDGTGYFSSNKIHCKSCCTKTNSKTGEVTYHHQMLSGAIVHPDLKEVIPFAPEPIVKQDGETKNDIERNASCLLYTSDAADDLTRVDLGGRRIIKKKKKKKK